MPPKQDLNKQQGESSDFPILCETCLGANPYVRMSRQPLGKECKVCTRPFTVFRWLPGAGMRYKKTEICQTCAKVKNVCQTCLLDLQYGLPTQVRDTALGLVSEAPTSNINREFYAQNMEGKLEGGSQMAVNFGTQSAAGKETLKRLARTDPYYKRNRPHVCSFFAKGECKRGDECPYRHEKPEAESTTSTQNIVDRYHGRNDPVARKILSAHVSTTNPNLAPPDDPSITTLFLSSLPPSIDTSDPITTALTTIGVPPSEVRNVVVVAQSHCAFINFKTRQGAEDGASRCGLGDGLQLDGAKVNIRWGRAKAKKNDAA